MTSRSSVIGSYGRWSTEKAAAFTQLSPASHLCSLPQALVAAHRCVHLPWSRPGCSFLLFCRSTLHLLQRVSAECRSIANIRIGKRHYHLLQRVPARLPRSLRSCKVSSGMQEKAQPEPGGRRFYSFSRDARRCPTALLPPILQALMPSGSIPSAETALHDADWQMANSLRLWPQWARVNFIQYTAIAQGSDASDPMPLATGSGIWQYLQVSSTP